MSAYWLAIRLIKKQDTVRKIYLSIYFWHQHSQSSFGRKIHFTFQPAAVIIESDLNRSFKSELQVLPIQPPSAMHAEHSFIIVGLFVYHINETFDDNSFVLAFPISSGDHGETWKNSGPVIVDVTLCCIFEFTGLPDVLLSNSILTISANNSSFLISRWVHCYVTSIFNVENFQSVVAT